MNDYLEVLWGLPDRPKLGAELEASARGPEAELEFQLAKRDGQARFQEKFLGRLEQKADELIDDGDEKDFFAKLFKKARAS